MPVGRLWPGRFFHMPAAQSGTRQNRGLFLLARPLQHVVRRSRKDPRRTMDNSLLISLSQQLAAYRSIGRHRRTTSRTSRRPDPARKRQVRGIHHHGAHATEGQTGPQQVSFVKDGGIARDISQGSLTYTGSPLDVAINGKGFFVVHPGRRALHPRRSFHPRRGRPHRHLRQQRRAGVKAAPSPSTPPMARSTSPRTAPSPASSTAPSTSWASCACAAFADEAALVKEGANLYSTDQAVTVATGAVQQARWKARTSSPWSKSPR